MSDLCKTISGQTESSELLFYKYVWLPPSSIIFDLPIHIHHLLPIGNLKGPFLCLTKVISINDHLGSHLFAVFNLHDWSSEGHDHSDWNTFREYQIILIDSSKFYTISSCNCNNNKLLLNALVPSIDFSISQKWIWKYLETCDTKLTITKVIVSRIRGGVQKYKLKWRLRWKIRNS